MFGLLLGTLQQFKQEASHTSEKVGLHYSIQSIHELDNPYRRDVSFQAFMKSKFWHFYFFSVHFGDF